MDVIPYNSIIEFQISNEHTFTNLSLSTLRDLIEVSKQISENYLENRNDFRCFQRCNVCQE